MTTLRELSSAPNRLLQAPCSKLLPDHMLAALHQTPPGPLLERSPAGPERGFSSPESLVMQNRRINFHTISLGFLTIDPSGACIVSAKFVSVNFAVKTNAFMFKSSKTIVKQSVQNVVNPLDRVY